MTDSVDPKVRRVVTKEMEAAVDQILKLGEEVPTIEYNRFVKHYLPYLAGQVEMDINQWLAISGSIYSKVNVVENGNVKFTVPPMSRRQILGDGTAGIDGIAVQLVQAEHRSAVNPVMADRLIAQALEDNRHIDPVDMEELRNWDKVLIEHGYESMFEGTNHSETETTDKEESTWQVDDYEDL